MVVRTMICILYFLSSAELIFIRRNCRVIGLLFTGGFSCNWLENQAFTAWNPCVMKPGKAARAAGYPFSRQNRRNPSFSSC